MSAGGDRELVRRYHEDGFLVIDGVFAQGEVEAWRSLEEHGPFRQEWIGSDQTIHLLGIAARHPGFLSLARDRRLMALLEPLIGPDIVLMHSKLAAKPLRPGAGEFPWHQDGAFYPHTNMDVPAVMVMLDDATRENGAMRMVRGSHLLGYLDHDDDEGFFSGACRRALWEERADDVVDILPRAGGISIHHPLMLHGSPVNQSGRPRRGLTFVYRAADAHQLADQVWGETGLVVAGAARGRVRCDPTPIRLPRFRPGTRSGERGSAWHQVGAFARATNLAEGLSEIGLPQADPVALASAALR